MNKIKYSNYKIFTHLYSKALTRRARQAYWSFNIVICLLFVVCILCFLYILPVWAEGERSLQAPNSLTDLLISGDNTIRHEHYNTSGDESSSLYQFEGPQTYNQFSLNFNKRDNPYTNWRGRVYGVINESDYRAKDRGFVPERLSLMYEKGDIALPFRAEAGDYYHYYSHRTIQRSLKGIQLEFQPDIGTSAGRRLSAQFASGARQNRWKDFDLDEDLTNGASLLFEDSVFGLWNLNFVHNSREAVPGSGILHRSQYVAGLAMEKSFPVWNQDITFEGEFDYFNGDHNGVTGATSGRGRDDNAIYLQLSGKSELPLTYRLRFEDYGQDYRPNSAVVPPDRRTREAHMGWRFDSGLRLRGRFQHFEDGVNSSNPTDTYTTGVRLSGPLFKGMVNNLSGNINAYVQDVENRSKSSNKTTLTVTANFSKPLFAGLNGNIDLFYQDVDNHSQAADDTVTRQARLSVDRSLKILDFEGNVRPGVMVRQIDDITSGTDDVYPTLDLNVRKGAHSFAYNVGFYVINPRLQTNIDTKTLTQHFLYRYTMENDTFGLEINGADRNPDPGRVSKSFRAAVFWTHKIGKRVNLRRVASRLGIGATSRQHRAGMAASPLPPQAGAMRGVDDLVPGTDISVIREMLAGAGITGGNELGNMIIYEVVLLDEIEQRQRLVVEHKNGKLKKSTLIIELDDVGNSENVMQTFERVRKELLDRYGNPDNVFEEGEFSANLVNDINNSKFIRITEWNVPGGTIRYGIPRRFDGRVRMEVQFAISFPPENNTLWSIERVR